jgi:hypothetical protein
VPKHFGHSGKILMLEKIQTFQEFVMLPGHFEHLLIKADFFLVSARCYGCFLSHERESMLARTILEALVNMRGQINLLIPPSLTWSQI